MQKEIVNSKTIVLRDPPFAYITLVEFGEGKGLLQVHSDWGTYSAFWGAMGAETSLEKFLKSVGSSYIEQNFARQLNYVGTKKDGFEKLTKFMAHCWPRFMEAIR